jgi:molecular chaperone GrpE
VTEQDGSAPTQRPGGEPSGERVVIRDRRKIDPSGGTKSKSRESGRPARPDSPARSGRGQDSSRRDPAVAEPVAGVADAAAKTEDDSGAAVGQAERGTPAGTGAEPEGTHAGPESREDGEESTEAAVRESAGLNGETAENTATGEARETAETGETAETAEIGETGETGGDAGVLGPLGAELEALRAELDERIRDLQRITAEYANYRKRVDRDRGLVGEQATGAVLSALLPVLDDLDRAREHGDLVGPFGAVAEQLSGTLAKFGLSPFGEKGDPFDPTRHEAVAHLTSAEVSEPTCVEVMRRGYLLGDRLLRPALVAVADPE